MKQVLKIKFLYIKIVVLFKTLKKIFFPELIRSATAKQIKVYYGISCLPHKKFLAMVDRTLGEQGFQRLTMTSLSQFYGRNDRKQ